MWKFLNAKHEVISFIIEFGKKKKADYCGQIRLILKRFQNVLFLFLQSTTKMLSQFNYVKIIWPSHMHVNNDMLPSDIRKVDLASRRHLWSINVSDSTWFLNIIDKENVQK